MNEDKLTPAINLRDVVPNEMSSEEFQRKLYTWFEDRGLMSDLRAHLRTQMISVFKEKGVGRVPSGSSISPKVQALNLLIAEFLLQSGYHYSLSVFSAEVPLTNVLPDIPGYSIDKKVDIKKWRFLEKDMRDILDTLGIQTYTEEAQNLYNGYYSGTNNDSLLTCIVRMLPTLRTRFVKNTTSNEVITAASSWRKDIYDILNNNNNSTQTINNVLKILSDTIEREQTQLRNKKHDDYLKLETQLQAHFRTLVKAHEERVAELQRTLNHDISKNQETAKNIERQQLQHRERIQKLIVREQNVTQRETLVKEKDAFIQAQEFLIKTKLDSLQAQQSSLAALQERLEQEVRQNKNESCVCCSREATNKNTDQDELTLQIAQLKDENLSLKNMNAEQQLHIRELSRRAALLVHELEDTQNAYHSLQSRNHGIITVPPLTSPVLVNRVVAGGAGEEGLRPASHRTYHQTQSFFGTSDSSRRRLAPRKLPTQASSSSDDLSPTNELLKEARQKLKKLEQESEEIDRSYKLYQSTLNTNFKQVVSLLPVPSTFAGNSDLNKIFNDGNLFNLSKKSKQRGKDQTKSKKQEESDLSSDIWDGAGTSGISFSALPTSDDEKSETEHKTDNGS